MDLTVLSFWLQTAAQLAVQRVLSHVKENSDDTTAEAPSNKCARKHEGKKQRQHLSLRESEAPHSTDGDLEAERPLTAVGAAGSVISSHSSRAGHALLLRLQDADYDSAAESDLDHPTNGGDDCGDSAADGADALLAVQGASYEALHVLAGLGGICEGLLSKTAEKNVDTKQSVQDQCHQVGDLPIVLQPRSEDAQPLVTPPRVKSGTDGQSAGDDSLTPRSAVLFQMLQQNMQA